MRAGECVRSCWVLNDTGSCQCLRSESGCSLLDSEAPRPGGSCCITVFAFVTLVFSDMTRFRQRPHKVLILEYRGPQ